MSELQFPTTHAFMLAHLHNICCQWAHELTVNNNSMIYLLAHVLSCYLLHHTINHTLQATSNTWCTITETYTISHTTNHYLAYWTGKLVTLSKQTLPYKGRNQRDEWKFHKDEASSGKERLWSDLHSSHSELFSFGLWGCRPLSACLQW